MLLQYYHLNTLKMKNFLFTILLLTGFTFLSAQDFALKQLDNSPRHHEWVKLDCGERELNCFVAYPETSQKATAVIVIHENRGLTDWVRSFSDQLAAKGFVVITPDLLSDFNEDIKGTADFESPDQARRGIYALTDEQVKNDLNTVQAFAENVPAGNGRTAVLGFCWGGSQSFRMATYNDKIKAALVFYGSTPDKELIDLIEVPVHGFYGGDDHRITTQSPETEKWMLEAGNGYDYVVYPGAGHAYMRQGDSPDATEENKEARDESWERLVKVLNDIQ